MTYNEYRGRVGGEGRGPGRGRGGQERGGEGGKTQINNYIINDRM